jgi:hypothetical protein
MAADPLDEVLRLVAEGRLTAEEAAPILAALDEPAAGSTAGSTGGSTGGSQGGSAGSPGGELPGGFGPNPPRKAADGPEHGGPDTLRIEVREGGRQVVNVRLPVAVGRFALDRVPGLSGEQVDRVREAMRTGFRGPVIVVDDGDSGVRILLE